MREDIQAGEDCEPGRHGVHHLRANHGENRHDSLVNDRALLSQIWMAQHGILSCLRASAGCRGNGHNRQCLRAGYEGRVILSPGVLPRGTWIPRDDGHGFPEIHRASAAHGDDEITLALAGNLCRLVRISERRIGADLPIRDGKE